MEAGLGTLSRMAAGHVDYVVVIANPTAKALEVARRGVALARERDIGKIVVVANRIQHPHDEELVRQVLASEEIFVVPDDRAIENADRQALTPIDATPESPGIQALRAVAARLMQSHGGGTK